MFYKRHRRILPRAAQQAGNILFLTLLAIVLFVALAKAVTDSLRGSNKDVSEEDARAQAADVINYAALLENTVSRLGLTSGCKDGQLSFYGATSPYLSSNYNNASAPSDKRCHIFEQSGGGVNIRIFSAQYWTLPRVAQALLVKC